MLLCGRVRAGPGGPGGHGVGDRAAVRRPRPGSDHRVQRDGVRLRGRRTSGNREVPPSVFTSALVQGLATGEADRDQDGLIGLDELYEYVYDQVRAATPNQTPGKWTFGMEGGLYIARRSRPVTTPAALPPELQQAMESPLAGIRGGAVQELAGILRGRHAGLALAARLALERLTSDDSRAVAAAATAALGLHGPRPPEHPRQNLHCQPRSSIWDASPAWPVPERRVRIGNSGGGDLNARAATSASWLKLRQIGAELVIAADSSTAGGIRGHRHRRQRRRNRHNPRARAGRPRAATCLRGSGDDPRRASAGNTGGRSGPSFSAPGPCPRHGLTGRGCSPPVTETAPSPANSAAGQTNARQDVQLAAPPGDGRQRVTPFLRATITLARRRAARNQAQAKKNTTSTASLTASPAPSGAPVGDHRRHCYRNRRHRPGHSDHHPTRRAWHT